MTLRGLLRRLATPRTEVVPRRWLRCPVCDAELVGPWHAGLVSPMQGAHQMGPTDRELTAKCPTHGHRPFNDPTKRPPWKRVAQEGER